MKTQIGQTPGLDRCRRILVANAKGGCGKTTVATNLCAAYAARGMAVGLVDNDDQGAGAYWMTQRPADAPKIESVGSGGPSPDCVVVDGQGDGLEGDAAALLAMADLILVPVLPSAIDIRAGERFITALMTRPEFRAAPRPVGVIANRVQPNTPAHTRLMHFLGCLNLPVAATLRDSPLYGDAMGSGLGVADLYDVRAARKEMTAWRALVDWVEGQLPSRVRHPQPLATGRPSREARRGMPANARLLLGDKRQPAPGPAKSPRPQRLSA